LIDSQKIGRKKIINEESSCKKVIYLDLVYEGGKFILVKLFAEENKFWFKNEQL
jgi:hypothetical protein